MKPLVSNFRNLLRLACLGLCGLSSVAANESWTLTLGQPAPNTGFRPTTGDAFPWGDAWGASILKDDDGTYHMWVSVMANDADITYWSRNSYVVYATSQNPEGPYTYVADAFPVMAHEVDVKRGPGGKWVAFITAGLTAEGKLGPSIYGAALTFDDGEPIGATVKIEGQEVLYGASTEATVMLTADDPAGPWSDPIVLLEPATLDDGIDANFTAWINDDGSLVGLWRDYPSGSQVHTVTASDYLDPTTYVWQDDQVSAFADPYDGFTKEGLEDMYVWKDAGDGLYHALFHNMVRSDPDTPFDSLSHAYSVDGTTWVYTGDAADTTVTYSDGSTTFSARARPHLLLEDGVPTHLITTESTPENGHNFALVEPILRVNSNLNASNNQDQDTAIRHPSQALLTTGTLEVGQRLVANTALLTDTNATTSFSYQWQRGESVIDGASGRSYTPTADDEGETLSAVVSYTDLNGHAQTHAFTWDGVVQSAQSAHTFYVSPDGSDSNDGSLSAPWRTLDGARLKVQAYLDGTGHIAVNFMSGHYQLESTVVFSSSDSGTANQTITYQAMQGHTPVFSSLQELSGWAPDPNNANISIATLPQGISHPRFLHDSRSDWMERSATAQFTTEEPAAAPGQVENTTDHLDRQDARSNFQYPASFSFPEPSSIAEYDLRQSIIGWHMEILPLATIDSANRRVTTAIPSCYEIREDTTEDNPAGLWILNSYEGLDTAGEWAALNGSIYLYGRDPNARIFVPTLTELVRVDDGTNGQEQTVNPVTHLRFKGLTFTGADFYVMQDTKGDTLADRQKEITIQHDWAVVDKPTGLLRLRNTSDIKIEDCRFIKSGGTGLRVDRWGQRIEITGNEFSHLGRCGVSLIGRGPGYGNVNHSNIIADNTFRRTGMEKWAAPALVIDQSTSNLVKHNAFSDTYFTAITVTGPRQAGILSKAEKLDAATDVPATALDYDGREFHYYGMSPSFEAFLSSTEEYVLDPAKAALDAMQFVYNYDNYIEENLFKDVGDGAGLFFNGKSVYISGGTRAMDSALVLKNYFRYNYIYDSKVQSFVDYAWYNDYDQDGAEMVGNMMYNLTAPDMPLILATSGYAEGGIGRAPVLLQSNLDLNCEYSTWAVDGNDQQVAGIQQQGNLKNGAGGEAAYLGDYQKMLAFLQRGSVASLVLPDTTALQTTLTAKVNEFDGTVPSQSSTSTPSLMMIGVTPASVDPSQLQVLLQAAGEGHYQLQRSTDLKTWTTVRAVEISDDDADIYQNEVDARMFYRIQSL